MGGLRFNLTVSFLSKSWTAILSLVAVPFYIRYLGIEAFGVIGAFTALQTVLSLLDLGMGATLTREFARLGGEKGAAGSMRDLLRTLECIYWSLALLIGVSVWMLSGFFADRWLLPTDLSQDDVARSIVLAGIAFSLQWPANLYIGGLAGLQRQALIGGINATVSTLRVVGTIAALVVVKPTLEIFFIAQAVGNMVLTAALAIALWITVPQHGTRPAVRPSAVRKVVLFAGGMLGISVTTVFLTQLDKAILSKTLSLEAFGFYAIASTLAGGLYVFVSPLFAVFFPKFSQLVAKAHDDELVQFYRLGSQLMAVIVVPIAAVAACCAPLIVEMWSGDGRIASTSGPLFALLVVGNALNGLMNIPYAMQLAHGWTSLAFYSNVVAIVLMAPLIYFLSLKIGPAGGAICWVVLMLGYIPINLQLMHSRLSAFGPTWRWYFVDVGAPAVTACVVAALGSRFANSFGGQASAVFFVVGLTLVATGAAAMAARDVRRIVVTRYLPKFVVSVRPR